MLIESLSKEEKTNNVYKILILGDGFVGKTAITIRFCEGQFQDEYKMTIGVNFGTTKFRYKEDTYTLQLWDIAGQERFKVFRTSYYKAATAAILVYDVTNRLTFMDLPNWTSESQHTVGTVPLIVIGNKVDLPESGLIDPRTMDSYKKQVSYNEGKEFADSVNATFLETSAKNNYNIDIMFVGLVDAIRAKSRSKRLEIDSFSTIELGFSTIRRIINENDVGKIYDTLLRLKQSIFQNNPYSVVLGNISDWIQYVTKVPLSDQVKVALNTSIDGWHHYYPHSLEDGQAVTTKI